MQRFLISMFIAIFATTGMAQSAPAPNQSCVQPGTWVRPHNGRTLSTADVLETIQKLDIVLLGETHDVFDHHRWQLQTIAQIYAGRPNMVLGFEAFPRRAQPILDKWVQGKLTEAEFLKQSDWNKVWKFNPKLYMPLFNFARLNRVPMVALNVERALIHKISKTGWKSIPAKDRLGIIDPILPSQNYLNMLLNVYGLHDQSKDGPTKPDLKDPHFKNFVDVQLTWDVAMAQAIADTLKKAKSQNQTPQMVAIIGRGHLEYGYGVPHQLNALGFSENAVLAPWDQDRPCTDFKNNAGDMVADAVFGLETRKFIHAPSGPKLGIMIETNKTGGVLVARVLKQSIAEKSSLKKNDVITKAAGKIVNKPGELVTIIKAMSPGTWLPLTIKRNKKTIEIIARFPAATKDRNPQ